MSRMIDIELLVGQINARVEAIKDSFENIKNATEDLIDLEADFDCIEINIESIELRLRKLFKIFDASKNKMNEIKSLPIID